ncbi:hypothetical protein FNV43_RR14821 [Rhamnella rubrinervis]|uniref:Uncharacterized protein n=1 Tax=Rhamnella rubrinervis TaxID=2594499 RepID=A0A8K0H3T7_9ROSA|nr:hypothetical protein FNV43_RR14821 [Rhamnella rubrinervis]
MRESSSSGSYIGRRSDRGSIPSTSGGGYRDVGLDDDSTRRELKGRRQDVTMFLRGEALMIAIQGGGHNYMLTGKFQQMQTEHFRDMYMWHWDHIHYINAGDERKLINRPSTTLDLSKELEVIM